MKGFATLDYIAVVVYLLAIAAFGSSFYRRNSSAREYFLGSRSISWLPAGISIIAADLSAISIMGAPAWSFKNNMELVWVAVGYPLMAPLVLLVFVPFYSRLNLYTAYEYLERRFSLGVRLFTSGLFQMLRGWHVAVAVYGPALVINMVTGLPVWACVFIMGFFTTFYTTLGGIKAVIWTDVIQFVTVTTGILVIFVTAIGAVPGGFPAAYTAAKAAGKLNLINTSLDPSQLTTIWSCLAGGMILSLAPLTTDQAILQRLFTTKSVKDCRQSVILQSILVVPITFLLYSLGVALYAFYNAYPDRLHGLPTNNAIVPHFTLAELPTGISGLVIAAIFAASMAVMSAGINSLTTASTVDFYQRVFRPNETPEHYARVGRLGTLIWGCLVTFLALLAEHAGDLVVAYNRVSSVLSGPMLGIFLLGVLTRRATSTGALTGAVCGGLAVIAVMIWTNWAFFYLGIIGVSITIAMGLAVSLFTPPPDERHTKGLVMGSLEPTP
ncbi:MAG: sodium/solute symporter [Bryobacterales bacterium]|nr:sodium/solute symporter [Bryobacterales bacterium]